jgi:hypothetical protein
VVELKKEIPMSLRVSQPAVDEKKLLQSGTGSIACFFKTISLTKRVNIPCMIKTSAAIPFDNFFGHSTEKVNPAVNYVC